MKLATGAAAYGAGVTTLSIGAIVATATNTAKAATTERTAWDRAFADHDRAKAAYEANSAIYDRISKAHQAGMPAEPTEALASFPYVAKYDALLRLDLDKAAQQIVRASGRAMTPHALDRINSAVAQIKAYRRDREANDRRHDWHAVSDRNSALCDAYCAAQDVLLEMPAPDIATLAWKLDYFLEAGGDGYTSAWSADFVAAAKADAHRLAKREG